MKKRDKIMMVCGVCAGAAAKAAIKSELSFVKAKGNAIVKAGCMVLEWYGAASFGFGVIGMMSKIDKMIFGEGETEESKEETNG